MKHLLVVLVAIVFGGCAHHEITEREVPANRAFLFKSKNELNATERDALAGDNAAAKRMADYYYFAKNRGNCIWWYKLAAARGDAVAKENLKKIQQEQE